MASKRLIRPLLAAAILAMVLALAASAVGAGAQTYTSLQDCTEAPAVPDLVSPANDAVVNPNGVVLQWSAVEGAALYRGQVSTQVNFATYVEATTEGTSFPVPQVLGWGTCYYWRVRAENDCGHSDWSAKWKFCTPPEPTATNTSVAPTETNTVAPPTETNTPGPPTETNTAAPPTETSTPTDTLTPTNTVTPSITPTASNTLTPSITPTRTNTPEGRYVFGEVRDVNGNTPLSGVLVSLYRNDTGSWQLLSEKTTDTNGHYAFGFSPVQVMHRIVETDPLGYGSDHVALPAGLDGTVIDPNTVEFAPPSEGSVGPLVFYDRLLPTATPTATPTETATPTLTATATQTATATATSLPQNYRVWLPILLKNYIR